MTAGVESGLPLPPPDEAKPAEDHADDASEDDARTAGPRSRAEGTGPSCPE
jgi:hypothetical protein